MNGGDNIYPSGYSSFSSRRRSSTSNSHWKCFSIIPTLYINNVVGRATVTYFKDSQYKSDNFINRLLSKTTEWGFFPALTLQIHCKYIILQRPKFKISMFSTLVYLSWLTYLNSYTVILLYNFRKLSIASNTFKLVYVDTDLLPKKNVYCRRYMTCIAP